MKRLKWLVIGSLLFSMSACTLYSPPKDGAVGSSTMDSSSSDDASTYGMGMDGSDSYETMSDDSMSADLGTIIYFDFDRSELRTEYDDLIAAHAANMNANTLMTVRLEGHADERGSREYNVGLGERRAQTVRRMLLLNGVAPDQISTVSYGEEQPVEFGSNESSYTKNRRVELVIN